MPDTELGPDDTDETVPGETAETVSEEPPEPEVPATPEAPIQEVIRTVPDIEVGQEFPVPLKAFLATLKGTPDEVWSRLLQAGHGREKHTLAGWRNLIGLHRGTRTR